MRVGNYFDNGNIQQDYVILPFWVLFSKFIKSRTVILIYNYGIDVRPMIETASTVYITLQEKSIESKFNKLFSRISLNTATFTLNMRQEIGSHQRGSFIKIN